MNLFEEELAEAKEMVAERSTEELFDNLKEMNRDVQEYTCGIQVILDELSRREKQNKEELYFVKYPLLNFTKYGVTFEELKISTIKRLGNVFPTYRVDKRHYELKQIIKNAKSIDEMVERINTQTDFHIVVKEEEIK
ncbi:hypothetical protein [Listeria ivanovii]|uniref:hypothetical protein n=1 Tax=Listeria ivanovii TaxID=1638 RepID=UPI000AC63171|nr:hypothetical protein [Listeria ivanovii]